MVADSQSLITRPWPTKLIEEFGAGFGQSETPHSSSPGSRAGRVSVATGLNNREAAKQLFIN